MTGFGARVTAALGRSSTYRSSQGYLCLQGFTSPGYPVFLRLETSRRVSGAGPAVAAVGQGGGGGGSGRGDRSSSGSGDGGGGDSSGGGSETVHEADKPAAEEVGGGGRGLRVREATLSAVLERISFYHDSLFLLYTLCISNMIPKITLKF